MKTTKLEVFVPPGVQMNLSARLRTIPRQGTPAVARKIAALWATRNQCPEAEIAAIDEKMETIMVNMVIAQRARKPRVIFENHNLHGTGSKRCKVFVLPVKSRRNYWANVTDIHCPACPDGYIRWHEAGFVPGYRICDGCGRTFLASGAITDDRQPKLILDILQ